jgi:site-specific recombinase XerC
MNSQVCILDNGLRVRFSLKRRGRDPFYLVSFRSEDGKRKERSTKEHNKRRACDSAVAVIKSVYSPKERTAQPSWDVASHKLKAHMEAKNLRTTTIDDYGFAIRSLRKTFRDTHGPEDISSAMAEEYKVRRLKQGVTVGTIEGNLNTLSVVYGHWWVKTCKLLVSNPFEDVEPPKCEKRPPRVISSEECDTFLTWLTERWNGWQIPTLFLEVKGLVGCRILELASAPTKGLKDGRIQFEAETTKGRKQRNAKLPADIFDQLTELAGREYVFEKFSAELRRIHRERGNPHHARSVKGFQPKRMKRWIQKESKKFFAAHPTVTKFKLHNFRGTAMSKARMAGVSCDDASIAFGCHPETMRKFYLSLDECTITDRVMDEIQGRNGRDVSGNGNGNRRRSSESGRSEGD